MEAALENPMSRRTNPHIGESLDDFGTGEGIYEGTQAFGTEDGGRWQLAKATKAREPRDSSLSQGAHRWDPTRIIRETVPMCGTHSRPASKLGISSTSLSAGDA